MLQPFDLLSGMRVGVANEIISQLLQGLLILHCVMIDQTAFNVYFLEIL